MLFRNIYGKNQRNESILHLKSYIKDVGLSSFRLYNKKHHRFEDLSEKVYQAFLSLNKNNDIIIQKCDKGNTVILLDKSPCIKKMEDLFADTSKFVKVEFKKKHKVNEDSQPLLDLEGNIKTCLDNLPGKYYISKEDYNFLKMYDIRRGIVYGLCKVHKGRSASNNLPPFRPILCAIRTCTYDIGKFFVPILKDFTINEHTVRDLFSFCDGIEGKDSNLYMASFGTESLFMNIPFEEAINIYVSNAFDKKKRVKGLLKKDFKQLLALSVKSSCFLFNNASYQQVDGVAMGSPSRSTLANLFLLDYESKWLKKYPKNFTPKYYCCYDDDIFSLFKAKDHLKRFLRYMNSRHSNIKFSCEEENGNKISFLDISVN